MRYKNVIPDVPPIPTEMRIYAHESVQADGRVTSRLVEKTIDARELNAGKCVFDFCLENQIAVGSLGLQNSFTLGRENLDGVDAGINDALAALDAADKQPSKE
jgi:hypothetical protein